LQFNCFYVKISGIARCVKYRYQKGLIYTCREEAIRYSLQEV
jgi:hypothetical protein